MVMAKAPLARASPAMTALCSPKLRLRLSTVTGAPGPTGGPDYVGVSHLDRLQARAPIPGAVRNMHRLGAAPLAHVPATFRAAEATDTEIWGEPARELGDDLFSHVACVINLKLRQSAAPVLTETTELDPEEPAETEPQE